MAKYLKLFSTTQQYDTYMGDDPFLPNVSLCEDTNGVHFTALVPVTGITLSQTEVSLGQGQTTSITATVLPANASNKNVTWSTSDSSKVSITGSGSTVTLTGVAGGSATIICKSVSDNTKTATCSASVVVPFSGTVDGILEYVDGYDYNTCTTPIYSPSTTTLNAVKYGVNAGQWFDFLIVGNWNSQDLSNLTCYIDGSSVFADIMPVEHEYINDVYIYNKFADISFQIPSSWIGDANFHNIELKDATTTYAKLKLKVYSSTGTDTFGGGTIVTLQAGDQWIEVIDGDGHSVIPAQDAIELTKGQTVSLTAKVYGVYGTSESVTWSVGNQQVLSVSANGKNATLTANQYGISRLTVTCAVDDNHADFKVPTDCYVNTKTLNGVKVVDDIRVGKYFPDTGWETTYSNIYFTNGNVHNPQIKVGDVLDVRCDLVEEDGTNAGSIIFTTTVTNTPVDPEWHANSEYELSTPQRVSYGLTYSIPVGTETYNFLKLEDGERDNIYPKFETLDVTINGYTVETFHEF